MIDLTKKGLPNAITEADGTPVFLNTDFRLWIRFYEDLRHDDEERDISYLFRGDAPVIDDYVLSQLLQFLYNPCATPKSEPSSAKTMDYILDGEYIFSALYATYGIDITEADMHWHKFKALCDNIITDDTLWGYAKGCRGYTKPSKKGTYERQKMRQREAWAFPDELTDEEKKKIEEFEKYFS